MLSDDRYKTNDIKFVLDKIKNSYFYDPNILDNFKKKYYLILIKIILVKLK